MKKRKRKRTNILNRHTKDCKKGKRKQAQNASNEQKLDPTPTALSVIAIPRRNRHDNWKTQVHNFKLVRDVREQRLAIYMFWLDVLGAPPKCEWKGRDGVVSIILKHVSVVFFICI